MELRDYLRGLRRHWIAILLMTLVGIWRRVRLDIPPDARVHGGCERLCSSTGVEDLGTSTLGDSLARSKVPTYLEIAAWRTVAEHAIEELGLEHHARGAREADRVSNPAQNDVHQGRCPGAHPGDCPGARRSVDRTR